MAGPRFANFDPLVSQADDGMWEQLDHIRRECPVMHTGAHGGFWLVTRYEDVLRVAQDWQTFTSTNGVALVPNETLHQLLPMEVDPPVQLDYRRLLNRHLSPQTIARMAPAMDVIAHRLIDAFASQGHCDFATSFAQPYPALTLFRLVLNTDEELRPLELVNEMIFGPRGPAAEAAFVGLRVWADEFLTSPEPDADDEGLVAGLRRGVVNGMPITLDEQARVLILLIVGGLETTSSSLEYAIRQLALRRDLQVRLRDDRVALDRAVEEFVRFEPPAMWIGRTATRDVELGGEQITAGDRVVMCLAAANRDGDEFPRPGEIDVDRDRNRHLSFGAGPHRCVGSNLARNQMAVALQAVLDRLAPFEMQPHTAVQYRSGLTRSLAAVPIRFDITS